MLNKDDAERIAKKLACEVTMGRAHDIAAITYQGKRVAQFGIRRGSRRDAGHGHIPRQIHVDAREAKDLSDCPMSAEDYFKSLTKKGLIKESD